jgi:hypothetical protein
MGLFKRSKNTNKPLIRQILDLIPNHILQQGITRYESDKYCSKYLTKDQLVAMTFGQLNKCQTLSDISMGIGVSETFIKDLGLRQSPARSTMSDGNKQRTWKVYEYMYFALLKYYGGLLQKQHLSHIIKEVKDRTIKIIDSTTISLCLSLFDWAKFRTAKGGIKIHTCWDDTLQIPDFIDITDAKMPDRYGLADNVFPKNTIIVEDKGYFDFQLMYNRTKAENVFVTRIKDNTVYETVTEKDLPDDKDHHILKDEIIRLTSAKACKVGMDKIFLRRVVVYDEKANDTIEVLCNEIKWEAATIAALYKMRWDIELFFKALKQNLQVKTFIGTSENAVKSQIYVALICYLLLQLINRNVCKTAQAFSNFVEKIRICLNQYCTLDYVCNHIREGAHAVRQKNKDPTIVQMDVFGRHKADLFS